MTADRAGPLAPGREPYRDVESLIRATHRELGRIAFGYLRNYADAEDAVQEACVKMMRCWPKVACLPSAARQRAYLIRTLINETLQICRQPYRRRELFTLEDIDPGWVPDFPGASAQPAKDELRRVWREISMMPGQRQEVVVLYAVGYEYSQVAEMLDIAPSTVGSHISLARKWLAQAADECREEGQA
jgi:RNA polymerase sigma-70 factor (ECF subfamily)